MKIAIVTDIHHGPQSHTKAADWNGLPVLERFVDHANAVGADLLLDLGDHISDTDHETDMRSAGEVATALARFNGPRAHVLGNHDVVNLSVADNEAIFGQSMASSVIDLGDMRLILWQPGVKIEMGVGFPLTAAGLPWLVDALNADERPAIIATHVPLSGHSQIGNYYFQRNPHYSTYPDHSAVREAVEATGRAAAWLSGHVHWNTITNVANVQHVTIQSLSERFTTMPQTAAAYAILTIENGTMEVEVFGNDPFFARVPFRRSGEQRWVSPLRPFTEIDLAAEAERQSA
ncbi:hypothetical protein XM25_04340 [Devosia sp. H5989]|nr:hypothetical protein XM25_04340 [Devosia sp. H5989]